MKINWMDENEKLSHLSWKLNGMEENVQENNAALFAYF